MPIDSRHWSKLISMRMYVEHLRYTLLNNQNISLCGQKSVELIKKSKYICYCKFWRYICRKYNTGQNLLPDIHLKHKCDNINKLVITLAFVGEKMIGGWKLYGLMNSLKWINASK